MRRFALPLLALLAGCAVPGAAPEEQGRAGAAQGAPAWPAVAAGEEPAAVVRGTARFGVDLYRHLAAEEGNLFFSPVGIVTAFGMAQAGARGATEAEIARVLHYPLPNERLQPALGSVLRALPIAAEGRQLTVANALWVHRDQPLRAEYAELLRAQYGAAPEQADFELRRAEAAARINAWAERNTNGRIRNLIGPDDLDAQTRLVLTNAVWMKADWYHPFEPGATERRAFHAAAGPPAQVPFLRTKERAFRHIDRPELQAIELPYRGEELSMIVMLPKGGGGIGAFERQLSADRLEAWQAELRAAEPVVVDLALPKIRLATRYRLESALRALGMAVAFSGDADFSGIGGDEDLAIDKAIHQTFLQVDEQGTEAAAATGLVIRTVSAPPPPQARFHADRPFFFLIRDNRSGALLFMGRIAAPAPLE
ncbi:MAG: serpin family protein [Allosphingosinicella sp.]|uniref:serpin family protein n=1 Tax=Allosphingosinicella sp. TaxID=2823234 RepID=UPI003922A3CE